MWTLKTTLSDELRAGMNARLFNAVKDINPIGFSMTCNDFKVNYAIKLDDEHPDLLDCISNGDVDAVLSVLDAGGHFSYYREGSFDIVRIEHAVVVNATIEVVLEARSDEFFKLVNRKDVLSSAITMASHYMTKFLLNQSHIKDPADISIYCNDKVKALIEGFLLKKSANQELDGQPIVNPTKDKRLRI